MATEGTQLTDSSQVAAADYSAGQFTVMLQSAAADRTVVQAAAIGAQAYGILQNKPKSGTAATVAFFGITKALAGGTITRGDKLMTNASGSVVTWTAGSGYAQIGIAQESAVTGQIMTIFFGATSPKVLT